MALAAYRRILRSIPVAFKGKISVYQPQPLHAIDRGVGANAKHAHSEDTFILANARLKARQLFEEGRRLKQSSEDAIKAIQHAEDVARMLRQNVVQGRAEGSGEQFSVFLNTRN